MSMSSKVRPALFNAFCEALTGPIPIIRGSTPATADDTILAFGVRLFLVAASAEASKMAPAPSFNPDAFPAVTVPPSFLNAGLSLPNISRVVVGFINSSFSKMIESFFR